MASAPLITCVADKSADGGKIADAAWPDSDEPVKWASEPYYVKQGLWALAKKLFSLLGQEWLDGIRPVNEIILSFLTVGDVGLYAASLRGSICNSYRDSGKPTIQVEILCGTLPNREAVRIGDTPGCAQGDIEPDGRRISFPLELESFRALFAVRQA